jgi:hypothetical protein
MINTQALAEKQSSLVLNTERLGPLSLINHFIQRLGLEQLLDRYVPTDVRGSVSHARARAAQMTKLAKVPHQIQRPNRIRPHSTWPTLVDSRTR